MQQYTHIQEYEYEINFRLLYWIKAKLYRVKWTYQDLNLLFLGKYFYLHARHSKSFCSRKYAANFFFSTDVYSLWYTRKLTSFRRNFARNNCHIFWNNCQTIFWEKWQFTGISVTALNEGFSSQNFLRFKEKKIAAAYLNPNQRQFYFCIFYAMLMRTKCSKRVHSWILILKTMILNWKNIWKKVLFWNQANVCFIFKPNQHKSYSLTKPT